MSQKGKFSGYRMTILAGLVYAFVGALGLTCGQLTNSYMALDPAVTMDRTSLGLGYTAYIIMQGVAGPIVGTIITKKGIPFSARLGSLVTAAMGVILALFLGNSTWLYIAGFGVVLSLFAMAAGSIMCFSTINNWFIQKRGRMISLALVGTSVIAVFYPIITNAVCTSPLGWRGGYWMIAVCALIGFVLSLFLKNKPSDLGQEVDGGLFAPAASDEAQAAQAPASKIYKSERQYTVKEAMKTPNFWLIAIVAFSVFAAFNLQVSQGNLYFVSKGITMDTMSLASSVGAIFGIIALLITSAVLDKYLEPVRAHGIGALVCGIVCIISAMTGTSPFVAFLYVCATSFGFSFHNASLPAELANMYGNTHYSQIHGTMLIFVAILASFIPTIAGVIYDSMGTYTPAYIMQFVICIIGFIAAMLVRIPKKKGTAPAEAVEAPASEQGANQAA